MIQKFTIGEDEKLRALQLLDDCERLVSDDKENYIRPLSVIKPKRLSGENHLNISCSMMFEDISNASTIMLSPYRSEQEIEKADSLSSPFVELPYGATPEVIDNAQKRRKKALEKTKKQQITVGAVKSESTLTQFSDDSTILPTNEALADDIVLEDISPTETSADDIPVVSQLQSDLQSNVAESIGICAEEVVVVASPLSEDAVLTVPSLSRSMDDEESNDCSKTQPFVALEESTALIVPLFYELADAEWDCAKVPPTQGRNSQQEQLDAVQMLEPEILQCITRDIHASLEPMRCHAKAETGTVVDIAQSEGQDNPAVVQEVLANAAPSDPVEAQKGASPEGKTVKMEEQANTISVEPEPEVGEKRRVPRRQSVGCKRSGSASRAEVSKLSGSNGNVYVANNVQEVPSIVQPIPANVKPAASDYQTSHGKDPWLQRSSDTKRSAHEDDEYGPYVDTLLKNHSGPTRSNSATFMIKLLVALDWPTECVSSFASSMLALYEIIQPPSSSRESGPVSKKRRVAFALEAGTCASPPNDRRPDSFIKTLHEAQTLYRAASLAEKLIEACSDARLQAMINVSTDGANGDGIVITDVLRAVFNAASDPSVSNEETRLGMLVYDELKFVYLMNCNDGDENRTAAVASKPSVLRFRLSWMLASVIRYNLRWLLDVPPPFISAPVEGGDYIEIPGVRSILHTRIKVVPEQLSKMDMCISDPSSSAESTPTSAPTTPTGTRSGGTKDKPVKPAAVDHCTVATADIPLSALVTYALRQMELETTFFAKMGLPAKLDPSDCTSIGASNSIFLEWEQYLSSRGIQNGLLREVEATQVS